MLPSISVPSEEKEEEGNELQVPIIITITTTTTISSSSYHHLLPSGGESYINIPSLLKCVIHKQMSKQTQSVPPKYEFHTLFLIFFIVIIFIQEKSLVFCSILAFFHFHHHHWSDTQAQAIISYDHVVTTTDSIFLSALQSHFCISKRSCWVKKRRLLLFSAYT